MRKIRCDVLEKTVGLEPPLMHEEECEVGEENEANEAGMFLEALVRRHGLAAEYTLWFEAGGGDASEEGASDE
tara:strand:+ start:1364 stop:1582 length:219 start_codon:yes stop_codon:yes gene_type:complete